MDRDRDRFPRRHGRSSSRAQLFENPISLIGILAGFFAGLRVFLLSKVKHEPSQRTTIYSLFVGSVFCLLVMAAVGFPIQVPRWEVMLFTPREILVPYFVDSSLVLAVIVLGGFSVLVNMFMAKSLRFATVGQISPFRYTAVAFAGVLDWSIWGVEPTWPSYVGFLAGAGRGDGHHSRKSRLIRAQNRDLVGDRGAMVPRGRGPSAFDSRASAYSKRP